MERGELKLPWRIAEANLHRALCQPSLAATDLAGKEWVFSIYREPAAHAVKLQEASKFMEQHRVKRGDVVAISRAPAQVGGAAWSAFVTPRS